VARLGIITGLRSEARLLGAGQNEANHLIHIAGADSDRAAALAEQSIAQGVDGLVSFGLAGGLDPKLSCGDVLLPETIVLGDRVCSVDASWRYNLSASLVSLFRVRGGAIAGSTIILASIADKARLFETSGAVAVDMESHAIAAVAAAHGIPFIAVRIVADPSGQSVPSWMTGVIGADGRVKPAAVLSGLMSHLFDLPDLIRLARHNRKSLKGLGRVALAVGRDFGFGEFGG
jgi:adenosylhomocysteine nucleosidase